MAEIAVVLFLQLMDIRDLTQTLWMTHVMIGLAVLYFIYTICNKFYHHTTTHALWICHLISCLRKEEAVYNAICRLPVDMLSLIHGQMRIWMPFKSGQIRICTKTKNS